MVFEYLEKFLGGQLVQKIFAVIRAQVSCRDFCSGFAQGSDPSFVLWTELDFQLFAKTLR